MERIYLDNAATSWPKPESVYTTIDQVQREVGAAAGRGNYQHVVDALRIVEQARGQVARFINAPHRKTVSFTFNGTDSLSTAIFGTLEPGDHVITSVVDHNSVLRPLEHLRMYGNVEISYVKCDETGLIPIAEVIAEIKENTKLVCLTHVSNVTGTIQPLDELKSLKKNTAPPNLLLLIDAAQSLGHIPVDVQALGCDLLAAPGHKGLLGPLGTGFLYVAENVASRVRPLRFGGTGTDGSVETQPTKTPDKFESGNLNVPGIAGLQAGIRYLTSPEGIAAHENWLANSKLLLDGLRSIDGVLLQGKKTMENRIGVFSVTIESFDCREASAILDSNWSIQTRAGLHCAPKLHRELGSEESGGTLRLSVGLFNTRVQIEQAIDAVRQLANSN